MVMVGDIPPYMVEMAVWQLNPRIFPGGQRIPNWGSRCHYNKSNGVRWLRALSFLQEYTTDRIQNVDCLQNPANLRRWHHGDSRGRDGKTETWCPKKGCKRSQKEGKGGKGQAKVGEGQARYVSCCKRFFFSLEDNCLEQALIIQSCLDMQMERVEQNLVFMQRRQKNLVNGMLKWWLNLRCFRIMTSLVATSWGHGHFQFGMRSRNGLIVK